MNKIFTAITVSILMAVLLVSGCTPDISSDPSPTTVPEASSLPAEAEEVDSISEFSVIADTRNISLGDWDNEVDLSSILGKPVSEEVRVLDHTADTFSGSHVKNLKYDGIELELFSPKDNGKTFWVKEIAITDSTYKTPKEASVGSSTTELKEKYPEMQQIPDGRTDPENCAYIYKSIDEFLNIVFEVKKGKTISIKLYKEMP